MNKLIYLTTIILITILSFSCSELGINDPTLGLSTDSTSLAIANKNGIKSLSVSTTTLNIAATAASKATFKISSNTNWTISSDQSWLTVSSLSGVNSDSIIVTATENSQTVTRTAVVIVSGTNVTPQKVTITQAAATVIVVVATGTSPYSISNPIVLDGKSNMTINYLEITNPNGHCIKLSNCSNITIQYCKLGPSKGEGVYLSNCSNITVRDCTMEYVESGVVADVGKSIQVIYNDIKNVQGPMPRGQLVQFGNICGAGSSISYNVGENILGQSNPEDAISLYMSNGTSASPIQVVGNKIRGGGPSTSGGGIMSGDMGGSYVDVKDNILVNPGQYGLTVSSGNDINISNNKIFSAQSSCSNIGLSAYKQYNISTYNITISNNAVNFTNKDGGLNDMWNANNCGTVTGWSTNYHDATLNASILPDVILGGALQRAIASKK
jgi:parallel beta-helix repeat protein